jgi:hypothetical protein
MFFTLLQVLSRTGLSAAEGLSGQRICHLTRVSMACVAGHEKENERVGESLEKWSGGGS